MKFFIVSGFFEIGHFAIFICKKFVCYCLEVQNA